VLSAIAFVYFPAREPVSGKHASAPAGMMVSIIESVFMLPEDASTETWTVQALSEYLCVCVSAVGGRWEKGGVQL
jgi:hypothetical protein